MNAAGDKGFSRLLNVVCWRQDSLNRVL